MLLAEGEEHGGDRVPRLVRGRDRTRYPPISQPDSADDTAAGSKTCTCWRKRRDHQIDVDLGECLRGDARAGFHQHLEPQAEPIGVELLVQAGPAGGPQVEIEDRRQLAGCRQRHELTAVFESTTLNDPMKHLGLQPRDDLCEMRSLQNALEQRTAIASVSPCRAGAPPSLAGPPRTAGAHGLDAPARDGQTATDCAALPANWLWYSSAYGPLAASSS